MKVILNNNKYLAFILSVLMLVGLVVPFSVLADAPVAIDTTIMAEGSNGSGYTGSKDAAFEIVNGNTLKISFKALTMDQETMTMPNTVESRSNGYVNDTFSAWISRYSPVILLNDEELSEDSTADSYAFFKREMVTEGKKYYDIDTIEVKPGVEITSNFFETNKITLAIYSQEVYIDVGNYDNGGAEPKIKAARNVIPSHDEYLIGRTAKDSGTSSRPAWRCNSDADKKWQYAITNVSYSIDNASPVNMKYYTGGKNNTATSANNAPIQFSYLTGIGGVIDVKFSFFTGLGLPVGTKKDVVFTVKATGYEDTTFVMSIKNPVASGFSVWNGDTVAKTFTNDELNTLWESEGSKTYTYSTYSTFPTFETSTRQGPTLKAVLKEAGIDLDSLSDNTVVKFVAADGYLIRSTVKAIKQTRYYYPKGESKNKFQGTTAEQYEGKVEVPYIIDMSEMNSGKGLRNAFGQLDPQDQNLFDFNQNLESVEILNKEAVTYDGLTPSLEDGTAVKEGDQLSFNFSIDNWQGSQTRYAGIYYTVSTDGKEPADPTLSSTMYNYAQFQNVNEDADIYNRYTFTAVPKTIIKVMTYIRGYAEPKILTLTYTHDHVAAEAVKENEVAATCTKEGSFDEVVYCSECKTEISREQMSIDKLPHTEEVIKEVAATCTEKGLTEGKKCSVCGEILEAQEELPALGHDWKVVPEVISTCTKKGSTAGVRCTRCGEYLLEPKEVPMIRHDYQNGKCTVCGAEDPDYKPDEPTPIEPDTKFTGLANEADKDGVWWYYTDGKIDKTHTGVDKNNYGWWRVENGKVNFKAQGIYKNAYGWWKTTDGKVTFKETGVFQNEYGWWRVEESKVNFNAQSIYQNKYGWWKTTDGKVTFKEQGVYRNEYGWWKCKDSKVDFNANGKVTYNGKTYNVKNGKATLS